MQQATGNEPVEIQRSRDDYHEYSPPYPHREPGVIDTYATEKSGKHRIFFGWYMVAASIVTNTIFSAAYFQGFGVLIIPNRTRLRLASLGYFSRRVARPVVVW